ncbi:low affinity immunoglobulin gamma Fc region receptor II-like isoform X1 [Sparus aurata]|uniref:low affinity immunoglobulin gamma Fc region receptor II-like isoform X1 n=1 Tax=Sparus aurata TaxID=8175 RepID=UPI0011C16E5D|nr:low affinity immunoglobulin gamma Fc region receptor II-like isoform X1 [Sparus aurata]
MEITTLCTVIAVLRVVPNRSQFFQYESVSLICEPQGNSSEWTIKRNTTKNINEECPPSLHRINKSYCYFDDVYSGDTGVYWCESAAGESSNSVTITVTAGDVILESPVLPVMEGDDVTLSCRSKKTVSCNHTADFYKDGLLIGSSSTGNMTIHSVSRSDEGLYRCNISGTGASIESRLTVRAERPDPPDFTLVYILLPVVVVCLSLVSVMLLCLWRSHKGKDDPDVPYTDVVVTQEVQPRRFGDLEASSTFYSTLRLDST